MDIDWNKIWNKILIYQYHVPTPYYLADEPYQWLLDNIGTAGKHWMVWLSHDDISNESIFNFGFLKIEYLITFTIAWADRL